MPKVLLKILAFLAGLGIFFYLLGRKFSIWEIEAVQQLKQKGAALRQNDTVPAPPSAGTKSEDLKQIKGIGKVIEEKLKQIGYYRLEQIANLSQEEKDRIEEELSFPGRIERDQWVEQAKALL